MLISSPNDIPQVDENQLHLVAGYPNSGRLLRLLWGAAEVAGGEAAFTGKATPATFAISQWGASRLASAVSGESASSSEPRVGTGLNENEFDGSGTRTEQRQVSEGAGTGGKIPQRTQAGAKLNLRRSCDANVKSTASGMRRRGLFCDEAQRIQFLPAEEAALAWLSSFAIGGTFAAYAVHLEKSRLLLGIDNKWKPEADTTVGRGLVKAGDVS